MDANQGRLVRFWRFRVCWIACAVCFAFTASLSAEAPLEYDVKAAFLLNFAKFTAWPPTAFPAPDSPIAICILGKDPFGHALDELVQDEVVDGRKVVVRRIAQAPAAHSCQIVFTQQTGKEAATILNGLGPGVLTVGEGESFVHQGGIIAFLLESRHVRFDIDQKAATLAELKLSSKLLAVARAVQK
ncbi:MAG TPA: YfiR family protein [Bryobacteraceae bacterium]|jgi:hypothetical protein|nr:YfiR family protein [Bryobacteraceae bacterium]